MKQVLHSISKEGCQRWFNQYPGNTLFYSLPEESTKLYYGIELETSCEKYLLYYERGLSIRYINTNFIFTSSEGSVNHGVEFKNHPATYKFLRRNKSHWNRIFRQKELKAGPTCGMHVHFSKEALNEPILSRFIKFIYGNKDFIFNLSGRNKESFNNWSYIGQRPTVSELMSIETKTRVLTCNMGGETIEFRAFASTLSPFLFWKNIEFCDCIYMFCKHVRTETDVTLENFMNYLRFRRLRYKNLYKFVMVNFCSEITKVLSVPDYRL